MLDPWKKGVTTKSGEGRTLHLPGSASRHHA
jgi:hypothetical protein